MAVLDGRNLGMNARKKHICDNYPQYVPFMDGTQMYILSSQSFALLINANEPKLSTWEKHLLDDGAGYTDNLMRFACAKSH